MMDMTVRRAVIESRIERCRDTAAENLLEVGRLLNAAKAEGLVPHGEWTAWVQEHAAMSERVAQRWMQAAREIPAGSPLAALGATKIRALLTLPAGEREEVAEQIGAASATSAEVEARVRAIRQERDEALRVMGALRKEIGEARAQAEASREASARSEAQRMDMARQKAQAEEQAALAQAEAEQRAREAAAQESAALRTRIAALERERAQQEAEIDRLCEALDEAQVSAARVRTDGDAVRSPVSRILSAIGALMTEAGRAPGDLARLASPLSEEDCAMLSRQAQVIGEWAMQIIAVCRRDDA